MPEQTRLVHFEHRTEWPSRLLSLEVVIESLQRAVRRVAMVYAAALAILQAELVSDRDVQAYGESCDGGQVKGIG